MATALETGPGEKGYLKDASALSLGAMQRWWCHQQEDSKSNKKAMSSVWGILNSRSWWDTQAEYICLLSPECQVCEDRTFAAAFLTAAPRAVLGNKDLPWNVLGTC